MATQQAREIRTKAGSQSGLILGAAAALLVAAATLAGASSVPISRASRPPDAGVLAGKVSVVGDAKVRQWTGRTFSIEVPLKWMLVRQDKARSVYVWGLLRAGQQLNDSDVATRAASESWTTAGRPLSARIRVSESLTGPGANAAAIALRTAPTADGGTNADYWIDTGSVRFSPPVNRSHARSRARSPLAFRTQLRVADSVQSDYFFSTCAEDRRVETWHLTVNTEPLQGKAGSAALNTIREMVASFSTTHTRSTTIEDCAS
jgi:hypothetical protein